MNRFQKYNNLKKNSPAPSASSFFQGAAKVRPQQQQAGDRKRGRGPELVVGGHHAAEEGQQGEGQEAVPARHGSLPETPQDSQPLRRISRSSRGPDPTGEPWPRLRIQGTGN